MAKINLSKRRHLYEKIQVIPVFFACDDNYVKFMMVTMDSIISNASYEYKYKFYVLHKDITPENMKKVYAMQTENVSVEFVDVSEELKKIEEKLSIRDYYSMTTYYRMFIADMFPEYDKVLYVDSDTIAVRDIAEFYSYKLGDNYIGAVQDYLVASNDLFGEYVEEVLGISRAAYFNAGVVIINSAKFREKDLKAQFIDLLNTYSFVVAQDQDYLNILCQDHVLWVNSKWNVQMTEPSERSLDSIGLIHYNLAEKPWQDDNCRYSEKFWEHAKRTADVDELEAIKAAFSEADQKRVQEAGINLMNLAKQEIANEYNYHRVYSGAGERHMSRQDIVKLREQYELEGKFDVDLEEDPPGRTLMPDEITYIKKSVTDRMRTRYAFSIARWFMNMLIRKKQFVIKDIKGTEYFNSLTTGAVITCNHFNAFDSFAVQLAYEAGAPKSITYTRKKLYRVIREGNYTSFPGFYGFLMRNCNTLPLSSNKDTMKKFMRAVDRILQKGHYVLFYPEQSMWWNYRKPKPLKKGAYTFAAKNNVPILPMFITMEDTDIPGEGGLPVQAYTINILPPIYPDKDLKKAQNVEMMMQKNADMWKKVYETSYDKKLEYTCEDTFVKMYK